MGPAGGRHHRGLREEPADDGNHCSTGSMGGGVEGAEVWIVGGHLYASCSSVTNNIVNVKGL